MRWLVFSILAATLVLVVKNIERARQRENALQEVIQEAKENSAESGSQNLMAQVQTVVEHEELATESADKENTVLAIQDENQLSESLNQNPVETIETIEQEIEKTPYSQRAEKRDKFYQLIEDNIANKEIPRKFFIQQFEKISRDDDEQSKDYQLGRLIDYFKRSDDETHVVNNLEYLKSLTEDLHIKIIIENEILSSKQKF